MCKRVGVARDGLPVAGAATGRISEYIMLYKMCDPHFCEAERNVLKKHIFPEAWELRMHLSKCCEFLWWGEQG